MDMQENTPTYVPLGRRGEIDPPPWPGEKGVPPVVLSGTFKIGIQKVEEKMAAKGEGRTTNKKEEAACSRSR